MTISIGPKDFNQIFKINDLFMLKKYLMAYCFSIPNVNGGTTMDSGRVLACLEVLVKK